MPTMSFFSSIRETTDSFGSSIAELRELFGAYEVLYGSPEDFAGLAPRLTSDDAFQADFSILTRSIGQRADGSLTLKVILTIVAIAVGGPEVEELESESAVALSVVVAFLAGVGGWKEAESKRRSRGDSGAGSLNLEKPPGTESTRFLPRHTSVLDDNEAAEAEALERVLSQGRAADPREAVASFHNSPLLQDALSRLELSALELKLHLDSIDSRMERMEPHLDEITARIATVDQERRPDSRLAPSMPTQRYSRREVLPEQEITEPIQAAARGLGTERVTAEKVSEIQPEAKTPPKSNPSLEIVSVDRTLSRGDVKVPPAQVAATDEAGPEQHEPTHNVWKLAAEARKKLSLYFARPPQVERRRDPARALPMRARSREVSVGSESPVELVDTKRSFSHLGWVSTFGIAVILVAIFWGLVLRGNQSHAGGTVAAAAETLTAGPISTPANLSVRAGRDNAQHSRVVADQPTTTSARSKPTDLTERKVVEIKKSPGPRSVEETPPVRRDSPVRLSDTPQANPARSQDLRRVADAPAARVESPALEAAPAPRPNVTVPAIQMAASGTPVVPRPSSVPANAANSTPKLPIFVVYRQLAGHAVSSSAPIYPSSARLLRVEGNVTVEAIISPAGVVESVVPVSGPQILQQAAVDAVRRWKYEPYMVAGEAVPVRTRVNFHFNPNP